MAGQRGWPQVRFRIPPDLRKWFEREAERNASSLNSEFIRALVERREKVETTTTTKG
jgi:Arc-like DNA binding dprotein